MQDCFILFYEKRFSKIFVFENTLKFPNFSYQMFAKPLWITNFKNYEQSTGQNAVELAKIHELVAQDTGASIGVAVSAVDIYRVKNAVSIPVFAQHIDAVDFGSFTGSILPQGVRRAGAIGTLINHSEKRIEDIEELERIYACAKKASLLQIICAENPEEVEKFSNLSPDFVAFEPPELIGSSKGSVSTEKPESIEASVKNSQGIPVMVGAGISSPQDVEVGLSLGAQGFLVASAIAKSSDPEKKLREFIEAFS